MKKYGVEVDEDALKDYEFEEKKAIAKAIQPILELLCQVLGGDADILNRMRKIYDQVVF